MRNPLSIAVILALATATVIAGQDRLAPENVPQAVISAFKQAYPGAQEVRYESEDEGEATLFEIEFKLAGKEMEAIYDAQGKLVYTEEEMASADLPQAVKAAISKDYPNAKLEDAEKLANPDGSLRGYEVEIEEGEQELEIELDAAGRIVKVKVESESAEKD